MNGHGLHIVGNRRATFPSPRERLVLRGGNSTRSGQILRAFLFFGFASGGPSGAVCQYTGASNPICFIATPGPRYGTSAAYDGSRYAYVFGGRNADPNPYLSDILKFDTQTASFVGWGSCAAPVLPTPMAFSSAAWVDGVAFVFGGEKQHPWLPEATNYYDVIRFDPDALPCPTVTVVATMPCPPWETCGQELPSIRSGPGTTAVTVSTLPGPVFILLAGGRHLTGSAGNLPSDSRLIYAFDPSTYSFTLKLVDLPICKALGSSMWYSPSPPDGTGRLYYFGGNFNDEAACDGSLTTGGGNQVIRYDINTL